MRFEFKRKGFWGLGLLGALIAYVGYHTVEGERGLRAFSRLYQTHKNASQELAKLEDERDRLDSQLALLDSEIDPEALEHQVRTFLGYTKREEKIIVFS